MTMLTVAATYLADSDEGSLGDLGWFFFLLGPIVYGVVYLFYRNPNARHKYESETQTSVADVVAQDEFVERRTGTRDSKLDGANDKKLLGKN
jgi:hypothetical protein